jgi:hypothetical protein
VNVSTWRLAVPGGWLYKVTEWDEQKNHTVRICFVPQPRPLTGYESAVVGLMEDDNEP